MPTPAAAMAAYSTSSGGPTAYRVIAPGQDNPASASSSEAEKAAIVAHSHDRSRTATQPSRNSAITERRIATAPRARGWTRASGTAEKAKVSASRPKAASPPRPSASAVASAGLANEATSRLTPPRACAAWMSGSSTVCGTSPVQAGWKKASAVPNGTPDDNHVPYPHDADGDEHQRQRVRRQHDADVGGVAGQSGAVQRDGYDHQRVADHAADWLSQRRRKLRDRSAENTPETVSALSVGFPALAGPGWPDDVGNQGSGLARRRLPRQLHPPTAPPTRRVAVHHDAHDG
jgi:hypothetical protein